MNAKRQLMGFFGLFRASGGELRQRRQRCTRRQEFTSLAVGLRHLPRLAPRHRAVMDELDELQHVAADTTAEAVPALLIEHDVEGTMRLAPVVRAVTEQVSSQ